MSGFDMSDKAFHRLIMTVIAFSFLGGVLVILLSVLLLVKNFL